MDRMVGTPRARFWPAGLGWIWYASLFVLGTWLFLNVSPWGIGVRVDSLSYLTAAKSLAEGECLCWLGSGLQLKPLVHFAPAYPFLVAVVSKAAGDVVSAARVVSAVLYGANLVAYGVAVGLMTRRFWVGVLCSFLVGVSPVVVEAHDSAMSEPLFLLLLLAALTSLGAYLGGNRRLLVVAIVFAALAVLTRYAGWIVVPVGVLGILTLSDEPRRRAIRDAAIFGLGVFLPVGLWLLRNLAVAGTATNRVYGRHFISADDVRRFLDVVTAWLTQTKPSHWLEAAGLIVLMVALAWSLWRASRSQARSRVVAAKFGLLWLGFAVLYPLFLAISRSFFDAKIPVDDRMLSPLYVALVVALCVTIGVGFPRSGRPWPEAVIGALLVIGLGPRMVEQSAGVLERLRRDGVGFTNRAWQNSPSVDWVRQLPPETTLFSNKALVLQLLEGRAAYQLPERYDEVKALPRTDFEQGLAVMYLALQKPNSYLLYFDPDKPGVVDALEDEFTVGLEPVLRTDDGVVLSTAPGGQTP
jgi:hypothetical protein